MLKATTLIDLLLPAAIILFLMPTNPVISSVPASAWVMLQLALAPAEKRWALWPMAFVILATARTWWLHEMHNPASSEDILLVVASFLAASWVSASRWILLLKMLLIPLPLVAINLGSQPWNVNSFTGRNSNAYLIGLVAVISICMLFNQHRSKIDYVIPFIASILSIFLLWQAQSRAGMIATAAAIGIVKLKDEYFRGRFLKASTITAAAGVAILISLRFMRPSSIINAAGIDFKSDLGRLQIQNCYINLPFSGNNRFLYGIGFEHKDKFCKDEMITGVLEHAHNIYIQVWANTGIIGLIGMLLFLALLIAQWRKKDKYLNPILSRAGLALLIYVLLQGAFDATIIYWQVTQVFTGILLAIPFCATDNSNNLFSKPDRS
jgi:O-antigen ligase